MPDEIVSKYKLKKLLGPGSDAYAIIDNNRKLTWYNDNFSRIFKSSGLKQKSLFSLLADSDFKKIKTVKKGSLKVNLKDNSVPAIIRPLSSGNKIDGYLIKVKDNKMEKEKITGETDSEFAQELQKILTLLIKENSVSKLSNEILEKCVSLSKSDYAIIVYNIQQDTSKYDFTIYDP